MDAMLPQPIRLSNTIKLHKRKHHIEAASTTSHGTGPSMTLLYPWFRALPKDIAKYVDTPKRHPTSSDSGHRIDCGRHDVHAL
jgi:hypothetical protein